MIDLQSGSGARFSIVRPLGRGGFSDVALAEDKMLSRQVVLKQLRLDRLTEDESAAIVREAQLVAQTHHPNVVHVYDVIVLEDRPTIVLEYIAGKSLNLVLRGENWSYLQRVQALVDLAGAVDHLHQVGLRHGDIRPENILVSDSGRIVLTDFGMGQQRDDSAGDMPAIGPDEQSSDEPVNRGTDDLHAFQRLMDDVVPARDRGPLFAGVRDSIGERTLGSLSEHITPLLVNELDEETPDSQAIQPPTPPRPGRRRHAAALALVACVAVVAVLWPRPAEPNAQRVLLEAPVFTAIGDLDEEQRREVSQVVTTALEQAIFSSPYLTLAIDAEFPKEWAALATQYASSSDAIGSTVLPSIACEAGRCRLQLVSRENKPDAGSEAEIYRTEPVRFIADGTRQAYEISQHLFYSLPFASGLTERADIVSEEDLEAYTQLYARAHVAREACEDLLPEVNALKRRISGFPPLLRLGMFCGLEIMHATGRSTELKQQETDLRQHMLLADTVSPGLYGELFKSAVERDDFDSAQRAIEAAAQNGADWWSLTLWRADLHSYRGDYDLARSLYNELLQVFPSYIALYHAAINLYYGGEMLEAARILERGLKLYPERPISLNLLGLTQVSTGNFDYALSLFRRAMDLSDTPMYRSNAAMVYLLMGDGQTAEALYRDLLDTGEQGVTTFLNLADSLNQQNKMEAARYYYTLTADAEIEVATNQDYWTSRAQALAHLGRSEEAIDTVLTMRDRYGPTPQVLYAASVVYAVLDDRQSAAVLIAQAVEAGYSPHWYHFPWFEPLCTEKAVASVLGTAGGCDDTLGATAPD